MAAAPLPLADIRVVELGTMVFAPAACAILADFGAEVIKIEPPGQGDLNRYYHRLPGLPVSELPYTFQADNRTKKSLALDVKSPAGYDALNRLIATADVFATNYRPGALTRLRLTYDDLKAAHPKLVYALGTAYGEEGPERDKPGYDAVSYWSRSGIELQVFPVDGWLGIFPYGSGDHPSGTALFSAIMLALYQRQKTGVGCKVSTSLLANGVWANATYLQAQLAGAKFAEKRPRDRAWNFISLHYKTSDDRILRLCLLNAERDWAPFCRAIDRPELIDDPRFARLSERMENMELLIRIVDEAFLAHDAEYWTRTLEQHDIVFAVLPTYADVANDPQLRANHVVAQLDHPQLGAMGTIDSPIQIEGCRKQPPTVAPELGQHTRELLRELGHSDAEIDQMIAGGIAAQFPPAGPKHQ